MTSIGGRRFILAIGCAGICTLLLIFHVITEATFKDIIIADVIAYITGNTIQKVKSTFKAE